MADSSNQYADQQLLELYRETDNNHYAGILLQRYTMLLFGVCMKYLKDEAEAQDAVQQVFIKALGEMNRYPITYFKSWIYIIAKNHCLMTLRKTKRKVPEEVLANLPESDTDALEMKNRHAEKEKMLTMLGQALEQLQEPQKQCVTLFYLHKCSYQQISDQTGFPLMQVKSAIQNGKRNIRIWIEKQQTL